MFGDNHNYANESYAGFDPASVNTNEMDFTGFALGGVEGMSFLDTFDTDAIVVDDWLRSGIDNRSILSHTEGVRMGSMFNPMSMVVENPEEDVLLAAADDTVPRSKHFCSNAASAFDVAVPQSIVDPSSFAVPETFNFRPNSTTNAMETKVSLENLAAQFTNYIRPSAASIEKSSEILDVGPSMGCMSPVEAFLFRRVLAMLMQLTNMRIEIDNNQHSDFMSIFRLNMDRDLNPICPTLYMHDQRASAPAEASMPGKMCIMLRNVLCVKGSGITKGIRHSFIVGDSSNIIYVLIHVLFSEDWRGKDIHPANVPAFCQFVFEELMPWFNIEDLFAFLKMKPTDLSPSRHCAMFFQSGYSVSAMTLAEKMSENSIVPGTLRDCPVNSLSFLRKEGEDWASLYGKKYVDVRPCGNDMVSAVLYGTLRFLTYSHISSMKVLSMSVSELLNLGDFLSECNDIVLHGDTAEEKVTLSMRAFVLMFRAIVLTVDVRNCAAVSMEEQKAGYPTTDPCIPNNAWIKRYTNPPISQNAQIMSVVNGVLAWINGDECMDRDLCQTMGLEEVRGDLMKMTKSQRFGLYSVVHKMYFYAVSNAILSTIMPDRSGKTGSQKMCESLTIPHVFHHVTRVEILDRDSFETACGSSGIDVCMATSMMQWLVQFGSMPMEPMEGWVPQTRAYFVPNTDPSSVVGGLMEVEPYMPSVLRILHERHPSIPCVEVPSCDEMSLNYGLMVVPSRTSAVMRMGSGSMLIVAIAVDPFVHIVNQSVFDIRSAFYSNLSVPTFATYGVATQTYLSRAETAESTNDPTPSTTWGLCAQHAFRVYTAGLISNKHLSAVMHDHSVNPDAVNVIRALLKALPYIYTFRKEISEYASLEQIIRHGAGLVDDVMERSDKTKSVHDRIRTHEDMVLDDVMYSFLQMAVSPAITLTHCPSAVMTLDKSRKTVFNDIDEWINGNERVPKHIQDAWDELKENVELYDEQSTTSDAYSKREDQVRSVRSTKGQRMYFYDSYDHLHTTSVLSAVDKIGKCVDVTGISAPNNFLSWTRDITPMECDANTVCDASGTIHGLHSVTEHIAETDGNISSCQSIHNVFITDKLYGCDKMGHVGPVKVLPVTQGNAEYLAPCDDLIALYDPSDTLLLHMLITFDMPPQLCASILIMMRPTIKPICMRQVKHKTCIFDTTFIFDAGWKRDVPLTLGRKMIGAKSTTDTTTHVRHHKTMLVGSVTNSPWRVTTNVTTRNLTVNAMWSLALLTFMGVEALRCKCCSSPKQGTKRSRNGNGKCIHTCSVMARITLPQRLPNIYTTPIECIGTSVYLFGSSMVVRYADEGLNAFQRSTVYTMLSLPGPTSTFW